MLSDTLNTNEVKDAAGSAQAFERLYNNNRTTEFRLSAEVPSTPHRLSIGHTEIGAGVKKRRRSVVRVDIKSVSDVDSTLVVSTLGYIVLDNPIGAVTSNAKAAECLANLMSFCASTGATTTILYDGTGNGCVSLLNGSL